ncbi:VOC family protein [Thalassoroseus pseudoceratinae]|uniref:VOC family protein n=1 Tax=Thalassoroseus pseudoceratinae TaxID=2713176 RepID=UPI00141DB885|nr:VOC family protein [Thalassoroseus pseudoceratinae]
MRSLFAVMVLAVLVSTSTTFADETEKAEKTQFSNPRVDFGIVVSDIDKALKFYKEALGLNERKGFEASAEMCEKAGLTDSLPLKIHVLQLGDGDAATRVKLMQTKTSPGKRADNRFINSTYGVSYLTMYVKDIDAALARAKKHDVKPIAKGPVDLAGDGTGAFLAIVRDPDGNMIELVGPKAK